MIELNSITVVLLLEALLALFLIIFSWFLFARKKVSGGYSTSNTLINKLKKAEDRKEDNLSELITSHLEPELQNKLLAEVKSNERRLYKQIIRIFLDKDAKLLGRVNQHIDKFSESYCKIISHVSNDIVSEEKIKESRLLTENERLEEQLAIAMRTIEEISSEYSRVFSGAKRLELENSSKKILDIFHSARQQVKATTDITEG